MSLLDFSAWKKKTDRLKMMILSAAHQSAKDLPPGFQKILAIYGRVAKVGGGDISLQEELIAVMQEHTDEPRPMWEPVEIHGWKIETTLYRQNSQLWWLVHATRRNEREPSDKDVAILDKVLAHLGADPKRDMIIGPRSGPADEPGLLPFGWWAWFNRAPLYEIQVNKDKKKDKEKIRIVPLGAPETDGYQSLDVLDKKGSEP